MTWLKELRGKYEPDRLYIKRLQLIADSCPELAVEALTIGLATCRQYTCDTELYIRLATKLEAEQNIQPFSDLNWVNKENTLHASIVSDLNGQISNATADCRYERVSQLQLQLARQYVKAGKSKFAIQFYNKALDNCSVLDKYIIYGELAREYITIGQISQARAMLTRMRPILEREGDNLKGDDSTSGKSFAAMGVIRFLLALCCVAQGQFEEAFLTVMDVENESAYSALSEGFLSDMGVYFAMVGLAQLPRRDAKFLATKDMLFQRLAQSCPYICQLLKDFLDMNYEEFFRTWEEHLARYKFDLFIGEHYSLLYSKIRDRALLQYLSVHAALSLEETARVFRSNSISEFTQEIAQVITRYKLPVRIDWLSKKIVFVAIDTCKELRLQAESLGDEYLRDAAALAWKLEAQRY